MKLYTGNEDVAFGDVNLQKGAVREAFGTPQNPGAGGWPTIRYYNKDTGYGGAAYEKLTKSAMCEELKDVQNMKNYVNYAATTTICVPPADAVSGKYENCTEKEIKYLQKWNTPANMPIGLKAELDRLTDMDTGSLQGEMKQWHKHRQALLKATFEGARNKKTANAKDPQSEEL